MLFKKYFFPTLSIVKKEYYFIVRNKINLLFIFLLPMIQIILYGTAINKDPKYLPTVINAQDDSVFTQTLINTLKNTAYFDIIDISNDLVDLRQKMDKEDVQFIITIPSHFTKDLIQKKTARLYIENDGMEPLVSVNALSVLQKAADHLLEKDLVGPLSYLKKQPPLIEPIILNRYNPEDKTTKVVLPPLIASIIMLFIIYISAISITREYEQSTIELLFYLNVSPGEVLIGKMIPYIIISYIQFNFSLLIAYSAFNFNIAGSYVELMLATFPFIIANLAMGLFISCIAQSTPQAMTICGFYFLPSLILGGFLYPTQGMPDWAQTFSYTLPLANYVKIIKAITLKGTPIKYLSAGIINMIVFFLFFIFFAVKSYKYKSSSYLAK